MKELRNRKTLFAVMLLLALLAGCKGEDPTAPPPGSGPGTDGGLPPVGASITLTASNPNPLVNSFTDISARVTVGGQNVPDGTAVEFATDRGTFVGSTINPPSFAIATTTGGVATVRLTSTSQGAANVTAVVNNVVGRITVNFQAPTTPPPTGGTNPVINSVSPNSGRPEGGDLVTITGSNFRGPVRVLFDIGGGRRLEATVASQTGTQVQVLTPAVNLGAGQTLSASVILINEAGTPSETSVTAANAFTFRRVTLTPAVVTVSPDTGPIGGGTRITIFGDGFEAPVQVAFSPGGSAGSGGWHQIPVVSVTFNQIIAVTPPARDVNPDGSGTLLGAVDLRIVNINSATEVVGANVFRYISALQITGVRPLAGTALGGTDITIDGIGFDPPVDVFIAGVLAQTIRVSGSQILARTSGLASPCSSTSGPVRVVNIDNGDSATSDATFNYIAVLPIITSVTSAGPIIPGSTITVNVQDPGVGPLGNAFIRFTINAVNVAPTPNQITAGTGNTAFTMVVPSTGFNFPTVTCTTGAGTPGTQLGPVTVPLVFVNATTGCTTTFDLTVQPPGPNPCLSVPTATITPSAPVCTIVVAPVPSAGTATGTATFTISNAAGSAPLTISAFTATPTTNLTSISVAPPGPTTIPAGTTTTFTITVDPAAAGAFRGDVTFTTNDPARPNGAVCVTGTAI